MADPTAEVVDVLVIGAGINGAAVAREAVLNGLQVTLVAVCDLASGTSAASRRLIHGGWLVYKLIEVASGRQCSPETRRGLPCHSNSGVTHG
jgi:glycerol-3-phosphate dehydrogenase